MKKKILFVIDSLSVGGAEKSLVSLLPLFNKDKYEIHTWIRSRGGEFESLLPDSVIIETGPKCEFWRQGLLRAVTLFYSLVLRIFRLLGVKRHAAEILWACTGWANQRYEGKWDVAVAYQQGFPTYYVMNKVIANKKITWINADIFSVGYQDSFNYRFYQRYTNVVSVSDNLKLILIRTWPLLADKFTCVYDILNPEIIEKLSREEIYSFHHKGKICLLTVARLVKPKGHVLALEAAKVLKDEGLDFQWYFIGDGPEKEKINALILKLGLSNNVTLMGVRANPYPYMKLCDVYVQTSLSEGLCMTIGEAKILHKPIVSTDFNVVYNQITNEKNGLVVRKSGEAIASGIKKMIDNDEFRNEIVKNLFQEHNTSSLTEVAKVEKLFDED